MAETDENGAPPQPPREPSGPEVKPEPPLPEEPASAVFSVDLEKGIEEALRKLREDAAHLVRKGQHTRVRLKFRGKELATMPLAVLVASEIATFWWAGLLRVLLVNVVGGTFLEVEVINEADAVIATGKQRLLEGELDEALEQFHKALAMDPRHALVHLNLGIALKLKGQRAEAQAAFEQASALDPAGEAGREARRQLETLERRQKSRP
jgi:tetratricopeptide (TPR) repeat protein